MTWRRRAWARDAAVGLAAAVLALSVGVGVVRGQRPVADDEVARDAERSRREVVRCFPPREVPRVIMVDVAVGRDGRVMPYCGFKNPPL